MSRLPRILLLSLLLSCRATTTRPYFTPLPNAATAEIELEIPEATRALAEAMARDSIALANIRESDGYIDSGWLDARTLEHTGARPLGSDVVRVRAWISPSKQFWSELQVEATYRPMADPSRPERELDAALPDDHPLQRKLAGVIRKLIEQYGDAEALKALETPAPAPITPDSTKPDTVKAKPDTTGAKPDSALARPDTTQTKPDTIPTPPDTTAKVKVDSTARVTPPVRPEGSPAAGFYVQVSAVRTDSAAATEIARVKRAGYTPVTVPEGGLLKIRVGAYPTEARAAEAAADLARKLGGRPFVVRVP
jgi:cell division protein FtsN